MEVLELLVCALGGLVCELARLGGSMHVKSGLSKLVAAEDSQWGFVLVDGDCKRLGLTWVADSVLTPPMPSLKLIPARGPLKQILFRTVDPWVWAWK